MTDDAVKKQVITDLGNMSENWGLPRSYAQIWGLLYIEGAMTQDAIRKHMHLGLGSVSEALKFLQNTGLVHISGKDVRKNIYAAQESMSEIKKVAFENKLVYEIEPMIRTLTESLTKAKDPKLQKRLKSLLSKYTWMRRFVRTMQRFSL
jgi:DNA-binding transcriptional regulator GbsR (MarR family)